MIEKIWHTFLRWPLLIRILLIASIVITTFGIIIHIIEPLTFPSIFDGIWWALITASTVGYGDFVPTTNIGKVVGILLILIGAGLVSSYFVTLAAATIMTQKKYMEGKMRFKGKNHIIIIGWNERSREIILELSKTNNPKAIVLIDATLEENPFTLKNLHFINGRANIDDVLIQGNIREASKVLITADQNKDENSADMNSILTLLTIKGIRPDLYCIVEILTNEQVLNAQRVGANEVIQSNTLSSFVMMNELLSDNKSTSLLHLMNQLNQSRLTILPLQSITNKSHYEEAVQELLTKRILLIGIKRGEEIFINPPLEFKLENNDCLLCIANPLR